MEFSRWYYSVATALVLTSAVHASDTTWFHGRDIVADVENFMGTTGDYSRTFMGQTKEGKACRFMVAKKGKSIVFTPGIPVMDVDADYKNNKLAQAKSFIISIENTDVNGGFEGNKLWSSYFIDRDRDLVIHGQFGVGFSLDLEKNEQGKLIRMAFRKTRHEDLGYFPLGNLDCILTP